MSAEQPRQFLAVHVFTLNPLELALTLLLLLTVESTTGISALAFLPLFLLGDDSSKSSLGMSSSISLAAERFRTQKLAGQRR